MGHENCLKSIIDSNNIECLCDECLNNNLKAVAYRAKISEIQKMINSLIGWNEKVIHSYETNNLYGHGNPELFLIQNNKELKIILDEIDRL